MYRSLIDFEYSSPLFIQKCVNYKCMEEYHPDFNRNIPEVELYRSDDGKFVSRVYSYEGYLYFEEKVPDENGDTQIWEVALDGDERKRLEDYYGLTILSVSERGLIRILGNKFDGAELIYDLMNILQEIGIDVVPTLKMNGCSIG